eukprot:12453452-Heterocapsa_arctica.AAC.1
MGGPQQQTTWCAWGDSIDVGPISSSIKQMLGKRIGLMTAGGVTRSSYHKRNHALHQYDWLITDEMQAQSGDCQLISSCVLGKMGFQSM